MTARCTTTSGPAYRCERPSGHEGECECRAPSKPWVGPARMPHDVTAAVTAAKREIAHAHALQCIGAKDDSRDEEGRR